MIPASFIAATLFLASCYGWEKARAGPLWLTRIPAHWRFVALLLACMLAGAVLESAFS